jgi:hypothetical protein
MSHSNGSTHVTREEFKKLQEDFKSIAVLAIQSDEYINTLFDHILKLKIEAVSAGWSNDDLAELKHAHQARAKAASIVNMQRKRLKRILGLD